MFELRRLWIKQNPGDHDQWLTFLQAAGLNEEDLLDKTYGLFDQDKLIATGSIYQNIIKCVAVDPAYSGGESFNQLLSALTQELYDQGYKNLYVYTKPSAVSAFKHIGFHEIERVGDSLCFMESGVYGFPEYIANLATYRTSAQRAAAIVMHANPFTKGHRYLIETARAHCDHLYVFVLSESMSVFTPEIRMQLVKEGTADLDGITILPTGSYMVSNQTFPSYFLTDKSSVTKIQATLDAQIFRDHIAPALHIVQRFVGEEPLSIATNIYNEAMAEVFKNHIELHIIQRKEVAGEVISASRVRALLSQDRLEETKALVVASTYDYLASGPGRLVWEQLKGESKDVK